MVETSFVLKTLDPARMFETTGLMIDRVLYDTLLTYKGSDVTKPVPDLATSFTASAGRQDLHVHAAQGRQVRQRRPGDGQPTWSSR